MQIFLTVICLFVAVASFVRMMMLESKIAEYKAKLDKDYETICKYLPRLCTQNCFEERVSAECREMMEIWSRFEGDVFKEIADLGLRQEQTKLKIDDAKKELMDVFQQERVKMENIRANRTNSTFKNLKAAFASTGKEQDES